MARDYAVEMLNGTDAQSAGVWMTSPNGEVLFPFDQDEDADISVTLQVHSCVHERMTANFTGMRIEVCALLKPAEL